MPTTSPAMSLPPLPAPFTASLARRWHRAYRHGECHAFTVALANALEGPTAYRVDLVTPGARAPRVGYHSCLRLPDGRALDVGGIVTLADLQALYRRPGLTWTPVPVEGIAHLAWPDDGDLVLALEVAARLPDFPFRAEAWAARHGQFGDMACPWDPAEGLLED